MSKPGNDDNLGTRVKGASLLARLEYLTERGGVELRAKVLERLSAADRKILQNRPLPSSLFSLELNARLDEAIAQSLNPVSPVAIYRELGRASAQKNLHKFHAIFLQGRDPEVLYYFEYQAPLVPSLLSTSLFYWKTRRATPLVLGTLMSGLWILLHPAGD